MSTAGDGRTVELSVPCLRRLGPSEKEYQPVRSSRRCDDGLIRAGVFLIAACAIVGASNARAQSAAGSVASASGHVQIHRGATSLTPPPGVPVNQGAHILCPAAPTALIT